MRAAISVESALATLAHEIRTPLNGILALSELIAAAELPEREREWASLVKSAAEHLANLATLVVDGVRAEARGLALRDEPFRPRALAEAVGGTLAARAEAKGLGASIVIAADLPELVSGDRVRLRAALENLADNAVKFTEAGQVGFSVASAPARGRHRLTFTITDSGVGLTRAEIAQAVPAVRAGECRRRAPLRRRRARSRVREAARRGDAGQSLRSRARPGAAAPSA